MFRKYDIRGRVESDLHDDFVLALGRAYGTVIRRTGGTTVALGRDCRLSGKRIMDVFQAGILDTEVHVRRLGVVPTPMTYYALYQEGIDGRPNTGSHNPIGWNGLKLYLNREHLRRRDS